MHETKGRYIIDFTDIPAERQRLPELEVAKRINNFAEVELSFSKEAARQEAQRCLSCRRCLGCALCLAVCKPKAIVFEQQDEIIDLSVDEIVISPTAEQHMPVPHGRFGYREYANVVSAFEFERMLSDSGPTGGMLLRPFDGTLPETIGFIIEGSNGAGARTVLPYVLQEALLALRRVQDLRITVLVPEQADSLPSPDPRISIKQAAVQQVQETAPEGNLRLACAANGRQHEEEFGMLVVARPFEPSPGLRELQKKLSSLTA
jgi:ferredoxin